MTGFIDENIGPFVFENNTTPMLKENNLAWHLELNAHVLIVDHPRGTGLSFLTNENEQFPTTRIESIDELFFALQMLQKQQPLVFSDDLFLTGESYAGNWLPMLATRIREKTNWRLRAVAIGNGLVDPSSQRPRVVEKIKWTGIVGVNQVCFIFFLQT